MEFVVLNYPTDVLVLLLPVWEHEVLMFDYPGWYTNRLGEISREVDGEILGGFLGIGEN